MKNQRFDLMISADTATSIDHHRPDAGAHENDNENERRVEPYSTTVKCERTND